MEGILHSDRLNLDFDVRIVHVGLVNDPFDNGGTHFMDRWMVMLSATKGGVLQSFDYYTGLGHRKLTKTSNRHDDWEVERGRKIINGATLKADADMVEVSRLINRASSPKYPKLDDVLCSLVIDSDAGETTFADWCSNFGYDEDSRKALATYEACRKNVDKLRKAGVTDLEKAREAFQDY